MDLNCMHFVTIIIVGTRGNWFRCRVLLQWHYFINVPYWSIDDIFSSYREF